MNVRSFKITRMNFYSEIRNPVYCGEIVIKKYNDEEERWAKSLYENGIASIKREMLDLIFREKLRFDGNECLTSKLNKAV